MKADLHIHTCASDGNWTPAELIAEARKVGLGALAITDHDSVANVLETQRLAKEAGLKYNNRKRRNKYRRSCIF